MPAVALAPTLPLEACEILPGLSDLIAEELAPKVIDIDLKGLYPDTFLRKLGALGGLGGLTPASHGGSGIGLKHAIQIIEEASKHCVSTGFLLWAQYALQWYVLNGTNPALAADMLPKMARGEVLGGTAQSNTMKSCVGIEETRLKAQRVEGGYRVNGVLPWVSNIGPEHHFHMGASLSDAPGLVIGLLHGSTRGLTLAQNAHFIGMEGTNTFACQFRDVFLPDAQVVCHPHEFDTFRDRTKSAFILLQMGMGLGLQVVARPTGVTAKLSAGTAGHGGAHGTQMWFDPASGSIQIMLIQRAGLPNGDASPMRQAFHDAAAKVLQDAASLPLEN